MSARWCPSMLHNQGEGVKPSLGLTGALPFCPQCLLLYFPGPRVPRSCAQSDNDQRRGPHSAGAQSLLHFQHAHVRPALPVALPGLEFPQVSGIRERAGFLISGLTGDL